MGFIMTALGSWSLRCDLGPRARCSPAHASSTRLDPLGSSFHSRGPAVEQSHRPPSRRLPAMRLVVAAGGGDRPSWTEAAAGMGRGRTKGEARVPKAPKRGRAPPSSDPDAAGRASRSAAASGARASEKRFSDARADADAPKSRRRGGRGGGRGGGGRGGGGRVVAERGGAAARAAAAAAPRSSAAVTSRNLDALAAAFAFSTTQRSVEETRSESSLADTRSSVSEPDDAGPTTYLGSGFRLVRCMPHLRRREADAAVSGGRVRVNGALVKPSRRVVAGDVVTLDGKKMDWEPFANAAEGAIVGGSIDETNNQSRFVYLKYHKPRGVTCTMEPSQKSSMLYALKDELRWLTETRRRWLSTRGDRASRGPVRVFPVGRLDRDSSGLVLLTDDGRVPEALLDPKNKAPKTYDVEVDRAVSDAAVRTLRDGVVIATTQQRDGIETVAPTLPCEVTRITPAFPSGTRGVDALRFVLREGRNRQIRKMCAAVGTEVTSLHRVSVGDVRLGDAKNDGDATSAMLECGGVRALEGDELAALARAVAESVAGKSESAAKTRATPPEGWGKRIRDGR